ncbi:MAG: hypothetical protein SFV18_03930 [Bryobacteraceae bacterium]|nr:hypothetical protein [Bryobacteraceae bacterium]
MRRDSDFFGDEELDLVYIAKRLREAKRAEEALDAAEIDYAVEVDKYLGGFLFKRELDGAFFYVRGQSLDAARAAVAGAGLKIVEPT